MSDTALGVLKQIRQASRVQREAEAAQFLLVARFADVFSSSDLPDGSDLKQFGHDGTPLVREGADLELGAALHMDSAVAAALIGDVLDVRHRMPCLWLAVEHLQIRPYQARKLADRVGDLDAEAARIVDAQLAPGYGHWRPGDLLRSCEGLVLAALPPEEAQLRQDALLEKRHVEFSTPTKDVGGCVVTDLSATLDTVGAAHLSAQINQIAHVLQTGGNTDALPVRKATALTVLANPARALQLLQASLLDQPLPGIQAERSSTQPEGFQSPSVAGTRRSSSELASRGDLLGVTRTDGCSLIGEPGHACGTVTVDPERLLPQVELIVHVTEEALRTGKGVARSNRLGATTMETLRHALRDSVVNVRPVLKVDSLPAADAYEVAGCMREAILFRQPASGFPWSNKRQNLDLDHTIPYVAREAGQTNTGNLIPLARHEHQGKTHGGWRMTQPIKGVTITRSPHGFIYASTPSGTWELHDPTNTPLTSSDPDELFDDLAWADHPDPGRSENPAWLAGYQLAKHASHSRARRQHDYQTAIKQRLAPADAKTPAPPGAGGPGIPGGDAGAESPPIPF